MDTTRSTLIGGTAALLLLLTGCAGAGGQFADSARGDAAAERAASVELRLSAAQAAQARAAYERIREVKAAESLGQTVQRGPVDFSVNEGIRQAKQTESAPVTSLQDRIREVKQAESESTTPTAESVTPESVREFKASQVQ
ncbi:MULTISPECIES: hypothetical protein [unclassified Agromyces]|uniref:hypothetical protein n=1 Tax=unclassified Agromyces TaxID=2639701 RepID=UPI0030150ABA